MLTLRHTLRLLAKSPGFGALVVLVIGVSVGFGGACVSLVRAFWAANLPYPEPHQLVHVAQHEHGNNWDVLSAAEFLELRQQQATLVDLNAYSYEILDVVMPGHDPERRWASRLSASAVAALAPGLQVGRWYSEDEDRPGTPWVVVLGDELWRTRFNADPAAIGQTMRISGSDFRIIGVAGPKFDFPDRVELWIPWKLPATDTGPRDLRYINAFGRLKPGVRFEQARADLTLLGQRMADAHPEVSENVQLRVVPLRDKLVPPVYGVIHRFAWAAVFVLLIAWANLANLMLVRGIARQHEVAVRVALGASRSDIVRTLLGESLVLGVAGAGVGCALCAVIRQGFLYPIQSTGLRLPSLLVFETDGVSVLAMIVLAAVVAILAGLAPAWNALRFDPQAWLKDGARGTTAARVRRLMQALVVLEIALATALLACLALVTRSAHNVLSTPLGFDPRAVATGRFTTPNLKDPRNESRAEFARQVLEQLEAQPPVARAALSRNPLFDSDRHALKTDVADAPAIKASLNYVTPGFFDVLGIPLLSGRAFDRAEHPTSAPVAIVNRNLAEALWPGQNPIGARLRLPQQKGQPAEPWRTVIGVVAAAQQGFTDVRTPQLYLPWEHQRETWGAVVWARARSGVGDAAVPALRQALKEVDPGVPYWQAGNLEHDVNRAQARRRMWLPVYAVVGIVAMLLAAAGLYGVVSHGVALRTREFGVRMALGAPAWRILMLVLRQAGWQFAAGCALGTMLALVLGRQMSASLYAVPPHDWVAMGAANLVLGLVALLACLVPSRRALRVDPLTALRSE